ncbi:hypothetical protein KVR01_004221 [Diaporthe batatas]|uniref:uncharacterized protein n=1 Tax=Diaporthe batatas TaxID=748121 RepID=UPI001D044D75|nr:uncharacterized protein KVR01_004221 [Diaporthe batatas]KAG8165669.1 hypothetical protein KVR01_004221 [Diaporthe batatas]
MDCFKFPANALPNLQSLAITSTEHLQPTDSDWKVRRILTDAAQVVIKLPQLQIIELWNCENGHAAVLRYEAGEKERAATCELTWRSSWYSPIGAEAIKAWEDAAHQISQITRAKQRFQRGGRDTMLVYTFSESQRLEFGLCETHILIPFSFSHVAQTILANPELQGARLLH